MSARHSQIAVVSEPVAPAPPLDVLTSPNSPGTSVNPAETPFEALQSEIQEIVTEEGGWPPCPNSRIALVKLSPPQVIRVSCGAWRCPRCAASKLRAARLMIGEGLAAAIERGDEIQLITLTDPPARPLRAKTVSEALDRLTSLLTRGGPAPRRPRKGSGGQAQAEWRKECTRRTPLIERWIAVVEIAPRSGRVHVHLLVTGPPIPEALLADCVRTTGFGWEFDIRTIETEQDAQGAIARLSTYLSKSSPAEGLLRRGATRVRPIHQGRKQRSWYPGGLRHAEEQLGIRRPAPLIPRHDGWFRAILSPGGTVLKVSPLKGNANAC